MCFNIHSGEDHEKEKNDKDVWNDREGQHKTSFQSQSSHLPILFFLPFIWIKKSVVVKLQTAVLQCFNIYIQVSNESGNFFF